MLNAILLLRELLLQISACRKIGFMDSQTRFSGSLSLNESHGLNNNPRPLFFTFITPRKRQGLLWAAPGKVLDKERAGRDTVAGTPLSCHPLKRT